MPTEVPAIPRVGVPSDREEYDKQHPDPVCDYRTSVRLPDYVLPDGEHYRYWAVRTPQPSSLISTCEIRMGEGRNPGEVPGTRKLALVTYEGVLAQARHDSPKYSMPRYDVMCHGEPVSYRLFMDSPDDDEQRLEQLPDSTEYQQLLEDEASAAAERAGCPLPEQ